MSLWASSSFDRLNQEAERRARDIPTAPVPSLDHLAMADYEDVYEPSDDTYLLLDGLSYDFDAARPDWKRARRKQDRGDGKDEEERVSRRRENTRITLEMGCGTGVATVHLAKLLLSASPLLAPKEESGAMGAIHYVTDINPHAIDATLRTARANGLNVCHGGDSGGATGPIEAVRCDLAGALLPRLSGQVDVLIFNPPYVPTPNDEVGGCGIEASWAGGDDGRVVIDRVLPQIARLLSWPGGAAYMISVDENMPKRIAEEMKERYGMLVEPLVRRRARNEFLTVQKMTLTRMI